MIRYRWMVACGVSLNDRNCWTHDTNPAIRVQGIGVGTWIYVLDGDGDRHLLLLLPHVQSARSLRKIRSPAYSFPGTSRWRLRCVITMHNATMVTLLGLCHRTNKKTLTFLFLLFLAFRLRVRFIINCLLDLFNQFFFITFP